LRGRRQRDGFDPSCSDKLRLMKPVRVRRSLISILIRTGRSDPCRPTLEFVCLQSVLDPCSIGGVNPRLSGSVRLGATGVHSILLTKNRFPLLPHPAPTRRLAQRATRRKLP